MDGLIDASFAEDILLDRSANEEIVEILFGEFSAGFPSFRRDDSDHSVVISIFFLSLSNKLEEVLELIFAGFQNRALMNFILNSKYRKI